MSRISKLEKEKRIFKVQSWIIEGVPEALIRKQIKTEWSLSLRQSKRYIKEARESWKVDADSDVETRRQNKIAQLEHRIRSLKPEYVGTPAGLKAQAALEKLIIQLEPYSVHRIDVTTDGQPLQMSPEDREKRIKELLKKRNANKTRKKNVDIQ